MYLGCIRNLKDDDLTLTSNGIDVDLPHSAVTASWKEYSAESENRILSNVILGGTKKKGWYFFGIFPKKGGEGGPGFRNFM